MNPPAPHAGYRRDIDGLRAVAVLAVIAFHTFPARFAGGFVGVDIFFVISGYLISGIIVSGLEKQTFTFRDFYARRVRRIFPSLALVFVTCFVLGWFLLVGSEYKLLGKHVAGGAAFVSNFVLWRESGYFDAAADSKILLHLWSLGIEEQFYLVWPLALFVAMRRRWSVGALLGLVILASFSWNVWRVRTDPTAAFYSPATRFWELCAGALLSWASSHDAPPLRWLTGNRGRSLRSVAGLALVLIALVVIRGDRAFPGAWALLPVGGAVLLLSAGPAALVNRYLLSTRPFVFVGLISYPLYLWHWPLLYFEQFVENGTYTWHTRVGADALAVILAWLSTRVLEQPIRSGRARSWKVTYPALTMAALFVFGIVVFRNDGFAGRMKDIGDYEAYFDNAAPEYRYFRTHGTAEAYRFDCDFYDYETQVPRSSVDPSCYTPHAAKTVVLWGDSHAQQFYYGLSRALGDNVSVLPFASSGCPPTVDAAASGPRSHCRASNASARQHIEQIVPNVVILAQASDHESTDWPAIVSWLHKVGVRHVVLVGPVPQWRPYLYKVVARHYWPVTPERIPSHLIKRVFDSDRWLHRVSRGADYTYLSLMDRLCNDDGCLAYVDGDREDGLITNDYGHLSKRGSAYVGSNILAPAVRPLLE